MISIENAILIALYYMIFGCFVSTLARRLAKPITFKEDLAATTLVIIVWPLIVLAFLSWFAQNIVSHFCDRLCR